MVKLRTSEKSTVARVSWPPIMSVPSAISWSAIPGAMYRDIVDFILFSSEISSITTSVPRCWDFWSVLPSESLFSNGKKLTFDETISTLPSSLVPTSNVTSIKSMFSFNSLHWLNFSSIHARLPEKESSTVLPTISGVLTLKIFKPALLQVAIFPSSLIVTTAFDMLASILSL